MIGPTIIFLCAVSLVATYMSIVNHLLRTDENWPESNQIKPGTSNNRAPCQFPDSRPREIGIERVRCQRTVYNVRQIYDASA